MCRTCSSTKTTGQLEVHRWINDVQWNFFHGLMLAEIITDRTIICRINFRLQILILVFSQSISDTVTERFCALPAP